MYVKCFLELFYKPEPEGSWWSAEHAIGKFIRIAREPVPNWDDVDEPAPEEKVWYIESHDGRELRWVNAYFITILPIEGWHAYWLV